MTPWSHAPECTVELQQKIAGWLLDSEVQVPSGRYAGGVVGWLNGNSGSHFVYGEITGYYLTFLADLLRQDEEYCAACLPRMDGAMRFLKRHWIEEPHPLTRAYPHGGGERDWRNRCHFSFDLAMMLRGAGAAAPFVDADLATAVRAELASRLEAFASETDGLLACIPVRPGATPERWSTSAGPFQVKTAAGILLQNGHVSEGLRAAAAATVSRWRAFTPDEGMPPHPLLYFIEGLLVAGTVLDDESMLHHAAHVFRHAKIQFERSDVVAQALRAGCIMRRMGLLEESCWPARFEKLAASLAESITEKGAVRFRQTSDGEPEHRNAWCAMFAAQALHQYSACVEGRPLDPESLAVLV